MTYNTPIFDLFDNNNNSNYVMQQEQNNNNIRYLEDLSISPISKRITTNSSSTSINSLFESLPSRSISTTTITPVLSRHNSTKQHFYKSYPDFDFTKIIDSKLKEHEQEFDNQLKLVVLLVGLPASGKSTICKQMKDHINNHTRFNSDIFNAGDVRRRKSHDFNDSSYFNPSNLQGIKDRELYATISVNNLINSLNSNDIDCGFLDATNTTKQRRERMINLINQSLHNCRIIILDVQCNDPKLLKYNISGKTTNKDYKDKDYIAAIEDFKQRTMHYKQVYQPITADELSQHKNISLYIKVLNGGQTFSIEKLGNDKQEKSNDYKEWVSILNEFKNNYMNSEGRTYIENVNKWYK